MTRSRQEIVLANALAALMSRDAQADGSRRPDLTFEDGVAAALKWILREQQETPFEMLDQPTAAA